MCLLQICHMLLLMEFLLLLLLSPQPITTPVLLLLLLLILSRLLESVCVCLFTLQHQQKSYSSQNTARKLSATMLAVDGSR